MVLCAVKRCRSVERRAEVRRLLGQFKASERYVCELMAVLRSSCRYQSRRDDSQLRDRLQELAREHPRFGYRRLHLYLGAWYGRKRVFQPPYALFLFNRHARGVDPALQTMGAVSSCRYYKVVS